MELKTLHHSGFEGVSPFMDTIKRKGKGECKDKETRCTTLPHWISFSRLVYMYERCTSVSSASYVRRSPRSPLGEASGVGLYTLRNIWVELHLPSQPRPLFPLLHLPPFSRPDFSRLFCRTHSESILVWRKKITIAISFGGWSILR